MQLKENRTPTKIELDAYNKILKLTNYSMEVCKPKVKTDKNGIKHNDNHHVPMRYSKVGEYIIQSLVEMGALILEANDYYINKNLNQKDRKNNVEERIKLQTRAIAISYRVEHCIRTLHEHKPFADSTISYWIGLLCSARKSMINWKDSTVDIRKEFK